MALNPFQIGRKLRDISSQIQLSYINFVPIGVYHLLYCTQCEWLVIEGSFRVFWGQLFFFQTVCGV